MAGSNKITKWLKVDNQQDEITLKTRAPLYSQVDQAFQGTSGTLTIQTLQQRFVLDSTTPNTITGPSVADILAFMNQNYLNTVGSTFVTIVHNTDSVAKVINFGAPLGSITIPPNSYFELGFTVTAPGVLGFYQPINNPGGAGGDPFALVGNGYIVKTGPMTYIDSQITGVAPFVSVTDPQGQTGNTVINVSPALQATSNYVSLGSPGIMVLTGSNTFASRAIIGTPPITVTNGNGVAGAPTIGINTNVLFLPASNVTVAPPVAGQNNAQQALQALEAAIPVVPAGPGFLAQNGAGVIFDRVFQAGTDINITIPDGSTGNPVFSFSPVGTTSVVSLNTAVRTFTAQNDILFWRASATMWDSQNTKSVNTLLRMDDTLTQGCSFHGLPTISWDVNGRFHSIDSGTWGSSVQPFKTLSWINTQETNTNPVVAGNNQGLADPKNIMLQFHQSGDSSVLAPALSLAGQRYKAFSLYSDTPGIATGDYAGEIAYFRGDGTFAGRAFNVVSNRESKKNIVDLDEHLETLALELIEKVQPIAYHHKDQADSELMHYGFLVNQIDEAAEDEDYNDLENLVSYTKDNKPSTLNVADTLALLFQAVKELKKEVMELRADVYHGK